MGLPPTEPHAAPEDSETKLRLKLSDATQPPAEPADDSKILRFHRTERAVHWAIAIPFMACYATALILVIVYNPEPTRPLRSIFSWAHRISGLCLAVLPVLAIIRSRGDYRIHFYNIRQAWIWTFKDIQWLCVAGLAAVTKRVKLPDQGKFNAAEKLNFMVLMGTYPLYILTGIFIWVTHMAFASWILHVLMALLATPLILGHIYMAVINPASRVGLPGMTSGLVDREWAKHHYAEWFRETYEDRDAEESNRAESDPAHGPQGSTASPARSTVQQANQHPRQDAGGDELPPGDLTSR